MTDADFAYALLGFGLVGSLLAIAAVSALASEGIIKICDSSPDTETTDTNLMAGAAGCDGSGETQLSGATSEPNAEGRKEKANGTTAPIADSFAPEKFP